MVKSVVIILTWNLVHLFLTSDQCEEAVSPLWSEEASNDNTTDTWDLLITTIYDLIGVENGLRLSKPRFSKSLWSIEPSKIDNITNTVKIYW